MNQAEYRRKTHQEDENRSWPLTIALLFIAGIIIVGIVVAWRFLNHDLYLLFTVLLPASLLAIVLIIAALNGRRHVIGDIFDSLLALLWFWQ